MTSAIAGILDTGILRNPHGTFGGLSARWVMQSIRAILDPLFRLDFRVKSLPQPSMEHLNLAGPGSFRLDKLALSTLGVATFFLSCLLHSFKRGSFFTKSVSESCLWLGSHWPPSGHCNPPSTRLSPWKEGIRFALLRTAWEFWTVAEAWWCNPALFTRNDCGG